MSEKTVKAKGVVSLDVGTNVHTTEGRSFLNNISRVSRVLLAVGTTVKFKGEEIVKTSYLGDFKTVILYRCPNGFFLFCDKIFGNNNVSLAAETRDELLERVSDKEVKKELAEATMALPDAA